MQSTQQAQRQDFVPVLLGTEILAYGMARAFWEAYGVPSVAWGTFPLTPTRHSKFIDVHVDKDLMEPGHLVEVLNSHAGDYGDKIPLVIPCGDEYAVELAEHLDQLDPVYRAASCAGPAVAQLNDKESFYALCAQKDVPCPQTVVLDGPEVPELPFPFPVALKPTDAAAWREHPFEGQKKAYKIDDRAQLEAEVARAYAAGYPGKLLVQDFIPGDDSNMRVLNGYIREDGTVSLLALGNPVLMDCAPMRIGNYAAIMSYGDDQIYDTVERLMSGTGYRGFFNIDMKYDSRDGAYKLFELNPRAGRSSFVATLSGHNLATYAVDDLVDGGVREPERAQEEVLWYGVPRSLVRRFAPEGEAKDRALALLRQGRAGTTVFGAADNDPRRLMNMAKLWLGYYRDFARYGRQEAL